LAQWERSYEPLNEEFGTTEILLKAKIVGQRSLEIGSKVACSKKDGVNREANCTGIAVLLDHRLAFTRCSRCHRCGVADAIAQKGSSVWGVIYEISDQEDISTLDKSEGFQPG
jgi:hypothetical protein